MKNLLLLISVSTLLFSCNKGTDEIKLSKQEKIESLNYCKNEDNTVLKVYQSVIGKDEAAIKADLQRELDLFSTMTRQFRENENNKNKILYLKTEPSVVLSNGTVEEWLISIHISDNPSDPNPQTTRTIYEGTEAGAHAKKDEIYWQNIW